jgi:hypothetical protein
MFKLNDPRSWGNAAQMFRPGEPVNTNQTGVSTSHLGTAGNGSAISIGDKYQQHIDLVKEYARQAKMESARNMGRRQDIHNSDDRINWIAIRLRVIPEEGACIDFGVEHISTHYHDGAEKVFIFVVQDGKPVTLEDDASLFPSDTLITALRLIKK